MLHTFSLFTRKCPHLPAFESLLSQSDSHTVACSEEIAMVFLVWVVFGCFCSFLGGSLDGLSTLYLVLHVSRASGSGLMRYWR